MYKEKPPQSECPCMVMEIDISDQYYTFFLLHSFFIKVSDGDLKPFLRKGKGKAYIKESKMRNSGTWATETDFGYSQDNEKRCINLYKH